MRQPVAIFIQDGSCDPGSGMGTVSGRSIDLGMWAPVRSGKAPHMASLSPSKMAFATPGIRRNA